MEYNRSDKNNTDNNDNKNKLGEGFLQYFMGGIPGLQYFGPLHYRFQAFPPKMVMTFQIGEWRMTTRIHYSMAGKKPGGPGWCQKQAEKWTKWSERMNGQDC
mmetsp:Transcript_123823/g.213950  ORF Transcript_123823/g.213950 Transcript_123823/m.213950 type:complete len:102 (+) Transcript_123823:24-329(+)